MAVEWQSLQITRMCNTFELFNARNLFFEFSITACLESQEKEKFPVLREVFFTAAKRSLGHGYVFTCVCHSVHGGVCIPACNGAGRECIPECNGADGVVYPSM